MCWVSVKYVRGTDAIETDCESFMFAGGVLMVRPVPLQRWANWLLRK